MIHQSPKTCKNCGANEYEHDKSNNSKCTYCGTIVFKEGYHFVRPQRNSDDWKVISQLIANTIPAYHGQLANSKPQQGSLASLMGGIINCF